MNPGGGGGGGGGGTCTTTSSVTVRNTSFAPGCATVAVGATVTWTWQNADLGHNVTFTGGPASPTQTTGTFQRTFSAAGTFSYECTVHAGMDGSIVVQ